MRKLFYTTAVLITFILPMSLPAYAQTITGCLSASSGDDDDDDDDDGGELYNVQVGQTPSAPCNRRDSILQWNQVGPQGAEGSDGADGAAGAGERRFEWVGSTAAVTSGSFQILQLTGSEMCHAEIPGSRMCTSEEVIHTVDPGPLYQALATVGPPVAWVRPVTEVLAFDPISGKVDLRDVSGVQGTENGWLGCKTSIAAGFYSDPSAFTHGLAIRADIRLFVRPDCALGNHVACCAPVSE